MERITRILFNLNRNFGPDWRTLLSAFLIVVAFPPWDLSFLLWIAPLPWLSALSRAQGRREKLREGIWLSILMTLGGFSWVAYSLRQFGGIPLALSILGLFAFAIVGQPQFPAYAILRGMADMRLKQRLPRQAYPWVAPLILALLYTALDWLAPKLFQDTFGHSQYNAPNVRQLAEVGGARMLTFLIWWFAEAAWASELWLTLIGTIRRRGFRPSLAALPFAMVALSLTAAIAWGAQRRAEIQRWTESHSRKVRMTAVQANIGDFEKLASESGAASAALGVVRKYLALSSHALNGDDRASIADPPPEIVVWPETAYPSTFRTPVTQNERARDEMIEAFVRYRQTPLLFGGYDHYDGKDFNALFFLQPAAPHLLHEDAPRPVATQPEDSERQRQNQLEIYRKHVLLPFGEYIPFVEHWDWIHKTFPQIGFFGRGVGPSVHSVRLSGGRSVKIAPIICYEALMPWYLIESAKLGSEIILNITNDSWFGPYGEPQLHLSLVTFRSIETRRSQFRATNTGISTLILPDGTITKPTNIGEQTLLTADVPVLEPAPPVTLVMRWGDWFGPFSGVLSLSLLGALPSGRKRRNS